MYLKKRFYDFDLNHFFKSLFYYTIRCELNHSTIIDCIYSINGVKYSQILRSNNTVPLIYVRSTLHNVFVYLLLNGSIFFKKSCGELKGVRKKSRRYFRNVFSVSDLMMKKLLFIRKRIYFRNIGVIINGGYSQIKPVLQILNSYFWIQRKKVYFWIKKTRGRLKKKPKFISNKRKKKFRFFFKNKHKYKHYIESYKIKKYVEQFLKKKKHILRLLFLKDCTSWAFNGCRSKNRLC